MTTRVHDCPEERSGSRVVNVLGNCIGCILALYFLPLMMLLVDEGVLKTFWISENSPEWVGDVCRTLYWPFIVIVNY